MHADRTNRFVLVILALVLLAAGAAGEAASVGAFGNGVKRRTLLKNPVSTYIGHHGDWLWPAAAVVALVIVVLSLRWLRTLLLSTDRVHDLYVEGGGGDGATELHPSAVTRAVVDEVESYRGVHAAKARIVGDTDNPTLIVTATLTEDADLIAVRNRIEDEAVAHVRAALDEPELPARVDLLMSTTADRRVS